ncbi:MAG: soluble NSF attachment family protein [Spirochaetaceae bacterium]|jgi:tetratricopeptide (TPR) repeat protein|nr:soluble NSF attachment family protein [Spirochaetaceae bacterium]
MASENIDNALTDFLSRNRKPVLLCSGIIVLAVVIFLIANVVIDVRNTTAIGILDETFIPRYEKLLNASGGGEGERAPEREGEGGEEEERQEAANTNEIGDTAEALIKDLTEFAASCSGYPSAKAWTMIGSLYFEKAAWKEAEEAFLQGAKQGAKTYLASGSYYNAAVAAEENEDIERALGLYTQALSYQDFPEAAHTQFAIGRLYELQEKPDLAKKAYQTLVDTYTDYTDWTQLATDRLIALDTGGTLVTTQAP